MIKLYIVKHKNNSKEYKKITTARFLLNMVKSKMLLFTLHFLLPSMILLLTMPFFMTTGHLTQSIYNMVNSYDQIHCTQDNQNQRSVSNKITQYATYGMNKIAQSQIIKKLQSGYDSMKYIANKTHKNFKQRNLSSDTTVKPKTSLYHLTCTYAQKSHVIPHKLRSFLIFMSNKFVTFQDQYVVIGNIKFYKHHFDRLMYILAIYVLICLAIACVILVQDIVYGHVRAYVIVYARQYAFSSALQRSYTYCVNHTTGVIVDKISTIVNASTDIANIVAKNFIPTIIFLTICIGYFTYYHWTLGLVYFLWLILKMIFTSLQYIYKYDVEYKKLNVFSNNIYSKITNIFSNIFIIKSMYTEKFESIYMYFFEKQYADKLRQTWYMYAYFVFLMHLMGIFFLRVLFMGFLLYLTLNHTIDLPVFATILGLFGFVSSKVQVFIDEIQQCLWHISTINNAISLLQVPHVSHNTINLEVSFNEPPSITFKDLTFVYEDILGKGKTIFDKFNLHIEAGSKVAFVGLSGSGKSTLVNLIMKIFNIADGKILMNDYDIEHLDHTSLTDAISYIPQKQFLFERALFFNIGYGDPNIRSYLAQNVDISFCDLPKRMQNMIIDASNKAQCHDFIMSLRKGYDTIYGIDASLSGGEGQRAMIAQAIINQRSQILLVDEATSALDNKNQKIIQGVIDDLACTRTTIIVAHRLSIVQDCRIILFQHGSIVADGYHHQLIQSSQEYYDMYHSNI